jgi:hypothetical protein
MTVKQTLANAIGILGRVRVSVMRPVVAGPPSDRALNSTTTDSGQEDLQWQRGIVGFMCPKTMVAGCDT